MSLRRRLSVFLGAMFLCVGLVTPYASAQQGGSGLQLSPTRTEISANPGEQKTFKITLKNITQGDFTAQAVVNDFESDNNSGTPKILIDKKERTPYSISNFLQGLKNVDLKAGESKDINLTLDIPGNVAPGAYFGAIRYSVVPTGSQVDGQRQIALNASVAHLVFVEVPGNVVQQIQVESLKFQQGDKSKKFFFSKPDKAAVSVKNLGNGFSRPFGEVTIKKPFGKRAYSYQLNDRDPRSIVLPNSSRTFTDGIKGISLPGKYTATASVAYGNGGEVVTYKTSFWYVPAWVFVLFFVLLVVAVGGGYWLYRSRYGSGAANKSGKNKPAKAKKKR